MNETKYFIRCDHCGEKIYFGEEAFKVPGRCGIYCSAECFAAENADVDIVTFAEADNCNCEVFKEEVKEVVVKQTSDPVKLTQEEFDKLLAEHPAEE